MFVCESVCVCERVSVCVCVCVCHAGLIAAHIPSFSTSETVGSLGEVPGPHRVSHTGPKQGRKQLGGGEWGGF